MINRKFPIHQTATKKSKCCWGDMKVWESFEPATLWAFKDKKFASIFCEEEVENVF
jgi:hypothetical protein